MAFDRTMFVVVFIDSDLEPHPTFTFKAALSHAEAAVQHQGAGRAEIYQSESPTTMAAVTAVAAGKGTLVRHVSYKEAEAERIARERLEARS